MSSVEPCVKPKSCVGVRLRIQSVAQSRKNSSLKCCSGRMCVRFVSAAHSVLGLKRVTPCPESEHSRIADKIFSPVELSERKTSDLVRVPHRTQNGQKNSVPPFRGGWGAQGERLRS